jgi:hypothetical protein
MKDKNIHALPVYPEHRIAYHPTTAKIFDRFAGISIYHLKQGSKSKSHISCNYSGVNIEQRV